MWLIAVLLHNHEHVGPSVNKAFSSCLLWNTIEYLFVFQKTMVWFRYYLEMWVARRDGINKNASGRETGRGRGECTL